MAEQESGQTAALVGAHAKNVVRSDGFRGRIYDAIAVQRPVVLEYLRSVRREHPEATPAELLKTLHSRYIATVTSASTGVGAAAAIPAVGIPLALGLGAADLLFFYETSALYVLSVAELHGIEVDDPERARPLVLGMLLGQKSQNMVTKTVLSMAGAGAIDVAKAIPGGWGEVLTQQLPDSALAPLTVVLAKQALREGTKLGAGTLGKALPFGVGAVVGGVGSFYFGRDVAKAAQTAFPTPPTVFPDWLQEYAKPDTAATESRAAAALHAAADSAKEFGEDVWGKVGKAADVFRSIDLDGDGVPDEPQALTLARATGAKAADTASSLGSKAAGLFKRRHQDADDDPKL